MIEAYKIGVEVALQGNLAKIIEQVANEFDALDKAIGRAQAGVDKLGPSMRGLASDGVSAAEAWSEAASAIERAATAASRMPRGPVAMPTAGPAMPAGGAAAAIAAQARATPAPPPIDIHELRPPGTALVPYQQPGVPALYRSDSREGVPQGQPYTPYGTGIPGRPTRPVPGALVPYAGGGGGGGDEPPGGGGFTLGGGPYRPGGGPVVPYQEPTKQIPLGAGPYTDRLDRRGQRMMSGKGREPHLDGLAAGMGAYGAGEFVKSTIDKGAETHNLLAGLRGEQFTDAQTKRAYAEAFDVQGKVKGSDVMDNLRLLSEIQASVQNPEEAMKLLPEFAKYQVALGTFGKSGDAEMVALIKLADEANRIGSIDPKTGKWDLDQPKLDHYLKSIMAAVSSTYGNVDPQQVLQWQRNLNWAGQNLPDDAIFQNLVMIQALGASRAGRGPVCS